MRPVRGQGCEPVATTAIISSSPHITPLYECDLVRAAVPWFSIYVRCAPTTAVPRRGKMSRLSTNARHPSLRPTKGAASGHNTCPATKLTYIPTPARSANILDFVVPHTNIFRFSNLPCSLPMAGESGVGAGCAKTSHLPGRKLRWRQRRRQRQAGMLKVLTHLHIIRIITTAPNENTTWSFAVLGESLGRNMCHGALSRQSP